MAGCRAGPGPEVPGCAPPHLSLPVWTLPLPTALTDVTLTCFHNPGTGTAPPGPSLDSDDAATPAQTAWLKLGALWPGREGTGGQCLTSPPLRASPGCGQQSPAQTSFSKKGNLLVHESLPSGTSGKEPACQGRRRQRHGFHPWVGKIPWRRAWPPDPVFLPG